ncbi:MAG: MCE family protein, partial [bacterium]|nr:MCE family protein [Candidatus Kapabacteria bacterium]
MDNDSEAGKPVKPTTEPANTEANAANAEAKAAGADANAAKADANAAKAEANVAKADANTAKTDANAAKADANTAKADANANTAKADVNAAKADANAANAGDTTKDGETAPPPEMVTGKDRGKRLIRAGVFAAIGFALLMIGVFVIGGKQNLFSETIAVYTTFKTVEGLKSGAPVMLSGIKVGTVSSVVLQLDTGTHVRVDMIIDG